MSLNGTVHGFRIGEVAARAGVSVDAIRYYEREGLLPSVKRTAHGARLFSDEAVARIAFLKQAQAAGLTLRDIKQLVGLERSRSRSACQRMRRILADRLKDVEGRLREMEAFRERLSEHLEACDQALSERLDAACPSLNALAASDDQTDEVYE